MVTTSGPPTSGGSENITNNDVNWFRPDEASPLIVNPDADASGKDTKAPNATDRKIPQGLNATFKPGIGYSTKLTCKVRNDNQMGDRNQPTVYFHLASEKDIAPGEVLVLRVKGLKAYGKRDSAIQAAGLSTQGGVERTATLLVQHDAGTDEDTTIQGTTWEETAGQGRVDIPMAKDPDNTYVEYPPRSESFTPSLYENPNTDTSALTYTIQGASGRAITAGVKQDLEFVVKNPSSKKSSLALIGLFAKVTSTEHPAGEDSLCRSLDLAQISLAPPKEDVYSTHFEATTEQPEDLDPLSEGLQSQGWTFVAAFKSLDDHDGPVFSDIESGDSLSFDLDGVAVSETSGTAIFKVLEFTFSEVEDELVLANREADGIFTKMGGGFFFDYLSTDQPEIPLNEKGKLVWSADNVKEYRIISPADESSKDIGPAFHSMDTENLGKATGYLLQATSREGIPYSQQVVVAVHRPSEKFRDVTVENTFNLNKTGYTTVTPVSFDSNHPQALDLLKPEPKNGYEGDRYAVVGISKFDQYTPENGVDARFELYLASADNGSKEPAGTVHVTPGHCVPIGLRVPPGRSLTAEFKVTGAMTRTLKATITTMVTQPRILPTPPASVAPAA
ncbi:hypothetical protein ABZ611_31315 [Streptomyces sp. NPDC007861]|uniref:hypothetical protein n=1 Tax=Streptomyces sp. NPDC007861 TaxID=3154893 RepID=UPI0033E182F0